MVIRLGQNFLTFTLNEKVTLTNPEFILILVNDFTYHKFACKLGTDLSSYTDRYNQFLVTVNDSADPLLAEVDLHDYGFHKYYVYETADADTFDYNNVDTLDLDTMTGLVEQGKMEFLKPEIELPYYANVRTSINHYGG